MTSAWSLRPTALVTAIVLAASAGWAAEPPVPPGALLRQGEWRGDIGTCHAPDAWQQLPAGRWPLDG